EEHQWTGACIASHMDDSVNLGERIARLKVDLRTRIKPLAHLWRTIHRCADHLGVATQDGISEGAGDDVRRLHSRMRVRWDDRAWLEGVAQELKLLPRRFRGRAITEDFTRDSVRLRHPWREWGYCEMEGVTRERERDQRQNEQECNGKTPERHA